MIRKTTLTLLVLIVGTCFAWAQTRVAPAAPYSLDLQVRPAPIDNSSRLPGDTIAYLGFDGNDQVDTVAAPGFGVGFFDVDTTAHSTPLQNANFGVASTWLIFFEEVVPGDTNLFAGIASWLIDPTVQSSDWITMGPIVVPAGGAEFSWRHFYSDNGFRDGYEVLVNSNGPFPGDFATGTQLLSYMDNDPGTAGDTAWAAQSVMLDAATYAGDTVFLAVHHNATDMFLMFFDDLTVTESGTGSSIPQYNIATITSDNDNDGVADSLGVLCQVSGVVHGIDLQGGGNVQFTMIDNTGGIGLFSSNDFGYTVMEGDRVTVQGSVSSFNGLAQMSPDTIVFVSSGNGLTAPTVVTQLGEATESEMTTVECVKFDDPAMWDGTGGSFNIDVTDGTNTFAVRVDNDVDLANMPIPTGNWFNITGIGGQFDNGTPALGGYQLLPRYAADISALPDPTVGFNVSTLMIGEAGNAINVALTQTDGNPDVTQATVELDLAASTATEGSDFTFATMMVDFTGKGTSMESFDVTILDDNNFEGDETIVLNITTVTNSGATGTATVTITITDDETGAIDVLASDAISMFPNPGNNQMVLESSVTMETVIVTNLVGQEVIRLQPNTREMSVATTNLNTGTYLVRVITRDGVWTQKWMKE